METVLYLKEIYFDLTSPSYVFFSFYLPYMVKYLRLLRHTIFNVLLLVDHAEWISPIYFLMLKFQIIVRPFTIYSYIFLYSFRTLWSENSSDSSATLFFTDHLEWSCSNPVFLLIQVGVLRSVILFFLVIADVNILEKAAFLDRMTINTEFSLIGLIYLPRLLSPFRGYIFQKCLNTDM